MRYALTTVRGGYRGGRKIQLVEKIVAGRMYDVGNSIDPMLCKRPVARIDAVADSGENGSVVAGP